MTTQFELQPVSVTSEAGTLNLRNDINPQMDKYFQYQEDMLKKHKKSRSRETRKEYMRNYMSRKRENSEKQREKDRESTLKSMSKSRQCKEFKEKELKAKRCARKNPETQVKGKKTL